MSRSLLFIFSLLPFVSIVHSFSIFNRQNPIQQVTDGLTSLEPYLFSILGDASHVVAFARFAHRYGKRYESAEEVKLRFRNFVESLELIHSTNSKVLPYTLGINEFADLSWEEFRSRHLGAPQNCSATTKGKQRLTDDILGAIPVKKDWREDGIVSPVKNQGGCGSCWTFSTTGALEAAYFQATGKKISLSEQQLVDCAGGFNNFGCHGGLPSQAFEYIKYNGGLETEEAYPYVGVNGFCKFNPLKVGIKVVDSVNITQGDEEELQSAVGLIRPVSIAFEVVHDFRLYKSGVYTSKTCGNSPMDVNHAVLAVGYGIEDEIPYWLVKNSWGMNWGDDGYFKIELGKNMCGVATCASYPIIEA